MAKTVTTVPYEFLARWCEHTGKLKGYHFKTLDVVKDAAGIISSAQESTAMNAEMAKSAGFPLSDILNTKCVAALESFDAANAERDAAITERDEAVKQLAETIAVKDAAATEVIDLRAALDRTMAEAVAEINAERAKSAQLTIALAAANAAKKAADDALAAANDEHRLALIEAKVDKLG